MSDREEMSNDAFRSKLWELKSKGGVGYFETAEQAKIGLNLKYWCEYGGQIAVDRQDSQGTTRRARFTLSDMSHGAEGEPDITVDFDEIGFASDALPMLVAQSIPVRDVDERTRAIFDPGTIPSSVASTFSVLLRENAFLADLALNALDLTNPHEQQVFQSIAPVAGFITHPRRPRHEQQRPSTAPDSIVVRLLRLMGFRR